MKFMMLVKADANTEAGELPDEKLIVAMGKYNEELVKAGVLLAGEGLQPSSKGARVIFDRGKRSVVDGPFAETKELIAGFWMFQVKSKEEAIEWAKRSVRSTGPSATTAAPEDRDPSGLRGRGFRAAATSEAGRAALEAEQAFESEPTPDEHRQLEGADRACTE